MSLISLFTSYPNLLATVSTKSDGAMRAENQLKNHSLKTREDFLRRNEVPSQDVVSAELVHSNTISIARPSDKGKIISHTDGLITNEKNIFLAITIADCLPIFLYDPTKEVVGLVHAGWRGLEKHIIQKAIETLKSNFESDPQHILAVVGPGIGVDHFEVQQNLLEIFKDYPPAIEEREGKNFINLKEIAQQQLLATGISKNHIEINPLCTFCQKDTYFSHRRGHKCPQEVMMALIGKR